MQTAHLTSINTNSPIFIAHKLISDTLSGRVAVNLCLLLINLGNSVTAEINELQLVFIWQAKETMFSCLVRYADSDKNCVVQVNAQSKHKRNKVIKSQLTFCNIEKEADFRVHTPTQFLTNQQRSQDKNTLSYKCNIIFTFCNLRGLLQLATDLDDQEIIQLIRKKTSQFSLNYFFQLIRRR